MKAKDLSQMLARFLDEDRGAETHTVVDFSKPVDWSVLDQQTGGDPTRRQELIQLFRVAMDREIAILDRAVRDDDGLRVADAARIIRHAGRDVGARGLVEISRGLGRLGANGSLETADGLLASLQVEYRRVNGFLDGRPADAP